MTEQTSRPGAPTGLWWSPGGWPTLHRAFHRVLPPPRHRLPRFVASGDYSLDLPMFDGIRPSPCLSTSARYQRSDTFQSSASSPRTPQTSSGMPPVLTRRGWCRLLGALRPRVRFLRVSAPLNIDSAAQFKPSATATGRLFSHVSETTSEDCRSFMKEQRREARTRMRGTDSKEGSIHESASNGPQPTAVTRKSRNFCVDPMRSDKSQRSGCGRVK